MTSPRPPSATGGVPYRQVQCEACGAEGASEICPVCGRPICGACRQARDELGHGTLAAMQDTRANIDRRIERKEDFKALAGQIAGTLVAGVGISAMAAAVKGIQAVLVGAVIIPLFTAKEVVEWTRYRRAKRRDPKKWPAPHQGDVEELEHEVALLAPCSSSCWGATGIGQDLVHSSAALHYGVYCKKCRPKPPRDQAEAMAAARLLALVPSKALPRPPGHPPMRSAARLALALGLGPAPQQSDQEQ